MGILSNGGKDYAWTQSRKRFTCASLVHPGSGNPIRFRSLAHMERHVTNMQGKALTCKPKQKRNRRTRKAGAMR